jgi:DNA-3-methyladenine glycosylase
MTAARRRKGRRLARSFYADGSIEVAHRLLNKVLARIDETGEVVTSGRIVEVEAYRGASDPASHAYRGLTQRNAVMFGPPGYLYVYFTYGMHWCANVVCAKEGVPEAVLLRALSPVAGIEAIRAARGRAMPDRNLLSGPARLCQGLGIDRADDGADLVKADRGVVLLDDGVAPPSAPGVSGRVGIRVGTEFPWRFWVPGDPNVSKGQVGPPSKGSRTGGGGSSARVR